MNGLSVSICVKCKNLYNKRGVRLKLQTYIIALLLSSASLPIMVASNPVDQNYQQE
jgi:hypothetical protein